MNPKHWRTETGLSLAAAAEAVGLGGKNPRQTYRRWEDGICRCPDPVVLAISELSGGRVTADDWLRARMDRTSLDQPKAAASELGGAAQAPSLSSAEAA
jgi:hypothetical protein